MEDMEIKQELAASKTREFALLFLKIALIVKDNRENIVHIGDD